MCPPSTFKFVPALLVKLRVLSARDPDCDHRHDAKFGLTQAAETSRFAVITRRTACLSNSARTHTQWRQAVLQSGCTYRREPCDRRGECSQSRAACRSIVQRNLWPLHSPPRRDERLPISLSGRWPTANGRRPAQLLVNDDITNYVSRQKWGRAKV